MKLTFQQLENWFAARVRFLAKKFGKNGLEPEDFVHDLLLLAVEQDFAEKPTMCRHLGRVLPIDPAHVNRFLLSRSIDLFNKHRRRRQARNRFVRRSPMVFSANVTIDECDDILNLLADRLPDLEFKIVVLKAFPTGEIEALAKRDRKNAEKERQQGRIKMNVHKTAIFDRHIAEHLGVAPATVSRTLTKAKKVLEEVLA